MPLAAGDRLGPYEIVAAIGAGGMGAVYRARDPRLNRDVAIKVSAERFSDRFEREARAVAALNHPNICQIYDVGSNYIVMELVEGENLKGPLPLEIALNYARQIAEALEAAHEKGIVHRDLKPANIKITPAGVVKILDFGLAKLTLVTPGDPENSPTLSMLAATQAGTILGTAAYMAPEQARGQSVDKRADIWAFGVVLHEMLTGKRLFKGETASDILAAVLIQEPDLSKADVTVRALLQRCLEKDPKKRLRDIGDAMPLVAGETLAPQTGPSGSWLGWSMAAFFAIAASVTGYFWWRDTRPAEKPLVRLDVDLGSDVSLQAPNGTSSVILSPDGKSLVYIAQVAGPPNRLYLRRFGQPKATELPGTQGAASPFFSPDGQSVGFAAGGKLSKVSIEGGAVVPLADSGTMTGGSWGEDGTMVYGMLRRGLFRIPAEGGNPALVLEAANGELGSVTPQVLPGGKALLFGTYHGGGADANTIDVLSVTDRAQKTLARGSVSERYLTASGRSGYLLYTNKSTLFAVPFDLDKLETRGAPLPILDDVFFSADTYGSQFDASVDGRLVYRKAGGAAAAQLLTIQWVDAGGKREPLVEKLGVFGTSRLSPDGKQVATALREGTDVNIQVYDLQRGNWNKVTFDHSFYGNPVWSPDGRFVVFGSEDRGLLWARADGSGQAQPLVSGKVPQGPSSFTPDGKQLAYVQSVGPSGSVYQIWTVPVEDDGKGLKAGTPQQFLKTESNDLQPVFSPDGKWLAYASNKSGKYEVYARAFPDNGSLVQISTNGGSNPVWSHGGHELLYQNGDPIMAVSYALKGEAFVPEKPRVWAAKSGGALQDSSLDGKRAVIVSLAEAPEAPKPEHEVVLIQNFLDELRRRFSEGR